MNKVNANMYGERRDMVPPVREGEELEVTIEAVGEKGDGIARKDGFVLFVPGAKEGDNVKIKITRVLRKVGFAEVVGDGEAPAEGEEESEGEIAPAEENSNDGEESEEDSQDSNDIGNQGEDSQGTEDFGEEPEDTDKKEE